MEVVGAELRMTDLERIEFLLETDAALGLQLEALAAQGVESGEGESAGKRPKYVTNYIGSKQKLVDWATRGRACGSTRRMMWRRCWTRRTQTCEYGVGVWWSVSTPCYMYKSKGLRVLANDRLKYSYHAARAVIENSDTRITEVAPDAEPAACAN